MVSFYRRGPVVSAVTGRSVHGSPSTEDVTDISLRTEHAPLFYADNREHNLITNSGENLTKYRD